MKNKIASLLNGKLSPEEKRGAVRDREREIGKESEAVVRTGLLSALDLGLKHRNKKRKLKAVVRTGLLSALDLGLKHRKGEK